MQTLSQLNEAFPVNDEVTFSELANDYPAVSVCNQYASAKIALHGAHLIDYTPHDHQPIIFTSKAAIYKKGKAIRGGIPICWPWFNAHPSDQSKPSHGYARTSMWSLDKVTSHKTGTTLDFSLPPAADSGLSATLQIHIGKSLSMTLTTSNDGAQPETYSEALHSYFHTEDTESTLVHGLDKASYIDTVGEEKTHIQNGAVSFPGEVDRIYHSDATVTIDDMKRERIIAISKDGSHTTIVWNPGEEKGAAMADLDNSEVKKFVCAESANARAQSITLAAGRSHSLMLNIKAL